MDVSKSDIGNVAGTQEDWSPDSDVQDVPGVEYSVVWDDWFEYYSSIPELQAVIDKVAAWCVGKGFKADQKTQDRLSKIRGAGKDTFDDILENAVRVRRICGDFFAEIIRNKRGELVNLKPLNPGTIKIISNNAGIITGYKQQTSTGETIPFTTDEMFHLPFNRLGSEVHGISTIKKIETIIKMRQEAMSDMKIVFHRYVKPFYVFKLDTDDPDKIKAFKTKQDAVTAQGENIYIPKDSVEYERVSVPQYSTLDPLPWIQLLNQYFIMSEGVPEVILGYGRDTTEASSKILYLAFQQVIEKEQNYLERQLEAQLKIKIELEFPADLMQNVQTDQSKDGKPGAVKKSDVKAKV